MRFFRRHKKGKFHRPVRLLQQLEERIVLDAAVNPVNNDNPENPSSGTADGANMTNAATQTAQASGVAEASMAAPALPDNLNQIFGTDLNVVLISNSLTDVQAISNAAAPDAKLIVYDAQADNLGTIKGMLDALVESTGHKIANLAVVGHGSDGLLTVGSDRIDFFNLSDYRTTLTSLAADLTSDAQIQFYGCSLADNVFGQALVDRIAIYSGADVFGSTDITGGTQHDWNLEYASDAHVSMDALLSADELTGINSELGFWMVKDINPLGSSKVFGVDGSDEMLNIGGTIYFVADDGVHGAELWKTDGTAGGTTMVKDIDPSGSAFASDWSGLTNLNGTLFFEATDGVNGYELWRSDGTSDGTTMVKDINPEAGMSGFAEGLTNFNGTLFFVANDGTHGFEGWKSDGTPGGTVMVKDINPGVDNAFAFDWSGPVVVNSTLYFEATDGVNGYELWKTDGTADGTTMVKDINPEAGMSGFAEGLTNFNGTLFFVASDGTHGFEGWKSDGTSGGTTMVKDINPGFGDAFDPNWAGPAVIDGTLYFEASDGVNGYELWKTDGTAGGTSMVKDIIPGSGSGFAESLTNVNGTLLFTATDGTHGYELWRTDGTPEGTQLVKDVNAGLGSSQIEGIRTPIPGMPAAVFGANDGTHGTEPWRSDGTANGTFMVGDVNPTGSSFPMVPVWKADTQTLLFYADDGTHGHELWAWSNDAPVITLSGASSGDLDTTFNFEGKVAFHLGDRDFAYSIAIQTDGKIVVVGDTGFSPNYDFGVVRYNADGSLDTTFDGDGKVILITSYDEHTRFCGHRA